MKIILIAFLLNTVAACSLTEATTPPAQSTTPAQTTTPATVRPETEPLIYSNGLIGNEERNYSGRQR